MSKTRICTQAHVPLLLTLISSSNIIQTTNTVIVFPMVYNQRQGTYTCIIGINTGTVSKKNDRDS